MLELDRKVLAALRNNVRDISSADVKGELAQDRIRQLALSGIARKFTTLCDFSKIGMSLHVAFAIKAIDKEGLRNWLCSQTCVNNLFRVSGDHDFFLDAYFPDMKSLWEFSMGAKEFRITGFVEYHIIHPISMEKAPIRMADSSE